ncbi:hypothetical protein MC7420_2520 [Coleofasciculus chthonoplastes PCC 7420]|uniref:Uncharacterized protein n=1 Tax=Coleofasciculus chthonoplastes PCC 7420 TaxID=118168 RepID=B4VZQ5_9CYAN|nr:hypothetical protein [Coleofasciculus chthonoplastes]EDX72612.1 hypothetical protein MC7420_2520 [Coleofasciculus chthonoplastes PCC 7420]
MLPLPILPGLWLYSPAWGCYACFHARSHSLPSTSPKRDRTLFLNLITPAYASHLLNRITT